ncbi:hypothetical protein [Kibdelosporangium phytohabitans]|uniref:Uncharacterized protein n=1 Tax=Kibdelosporangium phytohabitans TaxID=860235 RepID=A0A0N7F2X4_9PSEU|nr:hypothetical protein [Kibdelosporangium phytohabitans]ALG07039.1 hypothetical protein AOZ06_08950 [Kibdelosporangium phytohabitans]
MEHSHGDPLGGIPPEASSAWPLWLRLALVLTTAFVAGIGFAQTGELSRRLRSGTVLLAAASAALSLVSIVAVNVNVFGGLGHAVLVSAVAVLLGKPRYARWVAGALIVLVVAETTVWTAGEGSSLQLVLDTAYVVAAVAWLGYALLDRSRPLWVFGGVLVVAGLIRLGTSGLVFDRRIYSTALGLVLLAAILVPVIGMLMSRTDTAKYTAGAVAAALVAWSAAAAVPAPPELPVPGVPVLVEASVAGQRVPVLISPHRPGRNLVHVPASAGAVQVSVPGRAPVNASPVAGAEGSWAEVDLPAGRGEVVVAKGSASASVDVDTGDQPGPSLATGVDGPECASAALGGLVAGVRQVLTRCPAAALSDEDADALRKLVSFLNSRGVKGITLVSDDSERSVRAAAVVRDAATNAGIRIGGDPRQDNALVAVAGWSVAASALPKVTAQQAEAPVHPHGIYVAPWLLNTPIGTSVTTFSVPLRFDPREESAVSYAVTVGNKFGGESPTIAGFHAWRGSVPATGAQIYAVAQVTAMPMGPDEVHAPGMPMIEELAGQWIAKATVVPVSAQLD